MWLMCRSFSRSMILSINERSLIGRKSLGAVSGFLPALEMNITAKIAISVGCAQASDSLYIYNQLSLSLLSDSAFSIVMVCMLSGLGVLKGLKLLIAQLSYSGMKISVITSCITRALEHVSIVVSGGSEPGKWVSSWKFKDSFSLSVHEPSAFANGQDGCRVTEKHFRILEAYEALSVV